MADGHLVVTEDSFSSFASEVSVSSEPQRKKRRCASPQSDSGFGECPGLEVESFFELSTSEIQLPPLDDCDDEELAIGKHLEEAASQSQSEATRERDRSSSSNSNSSSASSSSSSSSSSASSSDEGITVDENFLDIVLNAKEVSGHPGRAAMMQRFLSHLRNNPDDKQLQHFLALLLSGPEFNPPRHRLRHVTTIQDAARLLRCSKRILVLSGAGISVSCGIPDFRSKDGLYSRVAKVFQELRDPQSVFDIRLFRRDPRPFFLTAKELYPGQFAPSLSHKFIQKLESRGSLLRNYSQNIDTLETIAGIKNVTMCHGSFASATCIRCGDRVSADEIKDKVLSGEIPYCKVCSSDEEIAGISYPLGSGSTPVPRDDDDDEDMEYNGGSRMAESFPLPPVVKPDIVFFGEDLPDEFHNNLQRDKPLADLVVVIGSSLRVRPVSLIPSMVPADVPQILINRESLPHCRFDVELLGNCDHIIAQLCKMMGPDFVGLAPEGPELVEIDKLPKSESSDDAAAAAREPSSEHDIAALKACWEPKTAEKLVDRLPADTYLSWHPRKYIFEGAEEIYDPEDEGDEDDDDGSSSSSSSSSSCSSSASSDRDKEIEDDLAQAQAKNKSD